jgi:uncharacterized membrane protein YkgB
MPAFADRLSGLVYRHSLTALRIALGAVFVWFGALKMADATPVAALVEATTPWSDPSWFVPALGAFEVALGLWFVVGRGLLLAVPVLVLHLMATFGVLVLTPEVAFQNGNPLLLTTEGEFVAKNIVLITAALVIGARSYRRSRGELAG